MKTGGFRTNLNDASLKPSLTSRGKFKQYLLSFFIYTKDSACQHLGKESTLKSYMMVRRKIFKTKIYIP